MILVIRHLVGQIHNVQMEFALACQNTKAILTLAVDQSALSTTIVLETKLA